MAMTKMRVVQYDNAGRKVDIFESIQEAATETGVNQSNISACLSGRRRTAGGFFWTTEGEDPPEPGERKPRKKKTRRRKARKQPEKSVRSVSAFDPDTGNLVMTYDSVQIAAVTLGLNSANIYMCCSGHAKTAGGFIWAYATGKNEPVKPVHLTKHVDMYSKFGEKLASFNSAAEASEYVKESLGRNISVSSIRFACRGISMTAGGFMWRYEGDTSGLELFSLKAGWRYTGEQALRCVAQYTEHGEWMRNWNSITLAAEQVNDANVHSIIDVCEGRRVLAGRCKWRYI